MRLPCWGVVTLIASACAPSLGHSLRLLSAAVAMPKRSLSDAAASLGKQAYKVIDEGAGGNEEVFADACRAFCECGGDRPMGRPMNALGFPGDSYRDVDAAATLLCSMRTTYKNTLATNGSRTAAAKQQAQSIAAAVYSKEVSIDRAKIVAGIPRATWEGGAKLAAINAAAAGPEQQQSSLGIRTHKDHVPWRRVHNW